MKGWRETLSGILLVDEYQLTMAQLYYRMGLHERQAQFEHFFRRYPDYGAHQAGYCINAGLEWLLEWMTSSHFRQQDLEYLRTQTGRTGERLFGDDFIRWLGASVTFDAITMDAIPEGRVVHPYEPLTTVQGPLAVAQILETSLLNHLNYQTLVATKASRIREAGRNRPLLEFGVRRAQEQGANAGARGTMIGGADFTSNVAISRVLGYPPKGTHAHSMVQAFMALGEGELAAFRAYADVYPDDCLLLVDTVNTLESGVPNAITVFEELRRKGHDPIGIRLDSGDLAYLTVQAARMLDAAGFPQTQIILSGDLDELVILQIIAQIQEEAPRAGMDADAIIGRLVYGVGTRLITSEGQPALDGVYKLVSIEKDGQMAPAIKISDTPGKTLNPGRKRVWRVYDQRGNATADVLSLEQEDPPSEERLVIHHVTDPLVLRTLDRGSISRFDPLLVPIQADGRRVYDTPTIEQMRRQRDEDLARLDPGVRRIINPHRYHVSLSDKLWELKHGLIETMQAPLG